MNPVLIKPEADCSAQLIVRGRASGRLEAQHFREDRITLLDTVLDSFEHLCSQADVVLVEGAGSLAEPNLREGDIANMGFAEAADVPVWLIGDIDRGGVFASLKGCLDVLSTSERKRVQALVINRFRGHRSLLDDALTWLEKETGKPAAGVIPHLSLDLPEEDTPYRHSNISRPPKTPCCCSDSLFRIAIVAYPRMSNHDDFDPLVAEAGVNVRFVRSPSELQPADVIFLPGSKHVASDLTWLCEQGFVPALERHLRYGGRLIGICGGMQLLGSCIEDDGIEGKNCKGLGWLPLTTRMQPEKTLRRVAAMARWPESVYVTGYEIHHGVSDINPALFPFAIRSADGQVMGAYVHGLFEQGEFRKAWLNAMGCPQGDGVDQARRTMASLDVLADVLEQELRPDLLGALLTTKTQTHKSRNVWYSSGSPYLCGEQS